MALVLRHSCPVACPRGFGALGSRSERRAVVPRRHAEARKRSAWYEQRRGGAAGAAFARRSSAAQGAVARTAIDPLVRPSSPGRDLRHPDDLPHEGRQSGRDRDVRARHRSKHRNLLAHRQRAPVAAALRLARSNRDRRAVLDEHGAGKHRVVGAGFSRLATAESRLRFHGLSRGTRSQSRGERHAHIRVRSAGHA